MSLTNLTDTELGRIVRESPLWPLLLEMEKEKEAAVFAESGSDLKGYHEPILCQRQ